MKKLLFFALILAGCAKTEIEPTNQMVIDGEVMSIGHQTIGTKLLDDGNYEYTWKFYSDYNDQYITARFVTNEPDNFKVRGLFPLVLGEKVLGQCNHLSSNNGDHYFSAIEGFIELKSVNRCLVFRIQGINDNREFSYYYKTEELDSEYAEL
jgi:hypothetical protein